MVVLWLGIKFPSFGVPKIPDRSPAFLGSNIPVLSFQVEVLSRTIFGELSFLSQRFFHSSVMKGISFSLTLLLLSGVCRLTTLSNSPFQ